MPSIRKTNKTRCAADPVSAQVDKVPLLAALVESSQDGIVATTLDGIITFWNPGAEQLFGYTAGEAIGESVLLLAPEDRREEEILILDSLRRGTRIQHYETVRVRKDGSRLDVSLSVSPIKSPDGAVLGGATIARDITAHKQAEERFRLVFEAAPSCMIVVRPDGFIALGNSAAEKLFGYTKAEMFNQPVEMLVPPRFRSQPRSDRAGLLAASPAWPKGDGSHLYGLCKDGQEVVLEVSLHPIDLDQGRFVLSAILDVTKLRHAADLLDLRTRELERSNAELEQFAYVASHDLQEPLRMVVSYTQLLQQRLKGQTDEKINKFIHYIVDGGKRMQQLVNDLLTYSRLRKKGMAFQPVDTTEVARHVLAGLQGMVRESGADIDIGPLPTVAGDPVQIGQVFQNLLANAIKFRSEAPPLVRVSAERAGDAWRFCFQDNGIGIEIQYSDRLFQMFQRLHDRSKYEGNGIGLALCKKIVENHRGQIWFESEPGKGTRFYFTLPAFQGDAP